MADEERLQRIKAGTFLATIAGISAFVGFSATLSAAKKTDPKYFNKGLHGSVELADAGAMLALRALGWGTLYAIGGTTCLCYGIWKLSGAKDVQCHSLLYMCILLAHPNRYYGLLYQH